MKKIRVLYIAPQPALYIVNYFNLLGKSVDLTVVFEESSSYLDVMMGIDYTTNNFVVFFLNGIKIKSYGVLSINIIKHISKDFDYIFVTNPLTPSGIISILFMKLKKINYIIESEGGFPGSGRGFKELFKRFILSNAYFYFSGNGIGDKYLTLYGAGTDRIIRYPFSSIFDSDVLDEIISNSQKEKCRVEHNLKGKRTAVGIGRLIESKNWEWLIDQWYAVNPEYHLYIIGEGPLKNKLNTKIISLKLTNVHLISYISHKSLLNYITQFDLLVHPTLSDVWGLTINEGMARGLPIVSTPYCLAALEMVEEGINGFISEPNDIFMKIVKQLLHSDSLKIKISRSNINKIKLFTINQMVEVHLEFINKNQCNN
jgi:glycosyltransferase involved in cell wall biosynthesis